MCVRLRAPWFREAVHPPSPKIIMRSVRTTFANDPSVNSARSHHLRKPLADVETVHPQSPVHLTGAGQPRIAARLTSSQASGLHLRLRLRELPFPLTAMSVTEMDMEESQTLKEKGEEEKKRQENTPGRLQNTGDVEKRDQG
jgi:hypothetical protein